MAEFDNEEANLDLYREIFNLKSPRDEVTIGCRDIVNKVELGDLNIKNHSRTSNFLQSTVLNNELDNGSMTQINNTADLVEDSSYENNVRLNNLENVRKSLSSKTDSESNSVKLESIDKKCTTVQGTDNFISDTNIVNDVANTVHNSDAKECKKKKGVSFPKDTLISGYLDPPDPWKNAPSWTTDELVSAYKKSCEILGTKPIVKLTQQLQIINSSNKRVELLSLKGEKLDQKQCECLEDILKRVQFKMLDLEASHLDDECAVALFDMIEFYESACQLNIAFNKSIQARGWQACSRLVRRTPSLTYLDLRGCDLGDHTIPIFGRALKLGCHLTVLHMESMNLSGRPLLILVAALKTNETLQELFLSENKLMPTDGVQLGNLLRYNHKLSLLDLRNNHLQDVGASHLCDGLMEQKQSSGLRTLVLWNNFINYQAMSHLGRALATSQKLEILNIGHNAIMNEGIYQLKDGLLRANSLLRLGLQGTRISDEGAVAVAEYIAESKVLLHIDLRDNDIKTGGLMALSHALRVNTSVTRIDLDKEPKKEPGMKDYIEQQSRLLRDILTFQQRNFQTALKREEQERIEQKLKAEAEEAATKKEVKDELQSTTLPANSSTESFTFIEEVFDKQQEKDEKSTENIKAKITDENKKGKEEGVASETFNDCDELKFLLHKEDKKPQQRPSVLFPHHELSPQTTEDSSIATSSASHFVSTVSEPFSGLPSQRVATYVNTCHTPAEMILSPQYFPKQIARKIFSVIRVQEDPFCQQLSLPSASFHSLPASFDPVSVSPILLVPVSSSPPSLLPISVPVLPCSDEVLQHLSAAQQVTSPSSSLFKDLAEETMKHMVSPDTDMDDKSFVMKNLEPKYPQETTNSMKVCAIENGASSSILESSITGVELSDYSDFAASDTVQPVSYSDTDICDNFESLVTETSGNKISNSKSGNQISNSKAGKKTSSSTLGERLNTENSVKEGSLVKDSSIIEEQDILSPEDKDTLQQKSLLSEDTFRNSLHSSKMSLASLELAPKQTCEFDYQEGCSENDCATDLSRKNKKVEFNKQHCDMSCDNPFLSVEESNNSDAIFSIEESNDGDTVFSIETDAIITDTEDIVSACLHVKDDNQAVHDKVSSDNDKLLQKHYQGPLVFNENFQNILLANERHSSPTLSTSEELMSACLNNFSSPSLLVSENTELSPNRYWEKSLANYHSSDDSNDHLLSPIVDLIRHDTDDVVNEKKDKKVVAAITSLWTSNGKLTNKSSEDTVIAVNNMVSDNIFFENVDFSLDEEPWLTVGVDSGGNDTEASRKSSKQPDFFTTLSLNGLTQELASALTSLDGSTSPFEVEDYDSGS